MLKIYKMFSFVFVLSFFQPFLGCDQVVEGVAINSMGLDANELRLHNFLSFVESEFGKDSQVRMSDIMREMFCLASTQFETELSESVFEVAWEILKKDYSGNEQQMRQLFMREKKLHNQILIILRDCLKTKDMSKLLRLRDEGKIDQVRHLSGTSFKYVMPNAIFLNKFLMIYKDLISLEESLKKSLIISDEKSFIYLLKFLQKDEPDSLNWLNQGQKHMCLSCLLDDIQDFCPVGTTEHISWIQNKKKQSLQDEAAAQQLKKQLLEQERTELKIRRNREKEKQKKLQMFEQKISVRYMQNKFCEWLQFLKNKKESVAKELKKPNEEYLKHVQNVRNKRFSFICDGDEMVEEALSLKVPTGVESIGLLIALDEKKALVQKERDARRSAKNIDANTVLKEKSDRYAVDWDKIQKDKDTRKGIVGFQESEAERSSCFCHSGKWLGLYEEPSSCIFCGRSTLVCK